MRARHFLTFVAMGLGYLGLAGGCSSDPDETGEGGSGGTDTGTQTGTTTGTTTGTNTGTDTGTPSGTGTGSVNDDDCEHALIYADVANETTGMASGTIDIQGDADFYKVELEAGDFYFFEASNPDLAGEEPDPYADYLDTVVSIFDETGDTLLATMDDAYPRVNTDTTLIFRAPTTGTYCIKIEDWGTWAGDPRPSGAAFDYEWGLFVPSDADGVNLDTEANDTAAAPQMVSLGTYDGADARWYAIFGGLDAANDVDVYQIEVPTGMAGMTIEDLVPRGGPGAFGTGDNGTPGNGSTIELGLIQVTDAAGTNIIASLDASKGSDSIFMPVTAGGSYRLFVQRLASSALGDNDFYDLSNVIWDTANMNQTEAETPTTTGTNDTSATAEVPTNQGTDNDQYFILGYVASGDTDFWEFPGLQGDQVALSCSALRSGSGLTPIFAMMASDGTTVLQTETENDAADVFWYTTSEPITPEPSADAVVIPTDGDYYLRVTGSTQSGSVTGNWYLCGITVLGA